MNPPPLPHGMVGREKKGWMDDEDDKKKKFFFYLSTCIACM